MVRVRSVYERPAGITLAGVGADRAGADVALGDDAVGVDESACVEVDDWNLHMLNDRRSGSYFLKK